MGATRLAILAVAAVSLAVTLAAALGPAFESIYHVPALYVAVAAAGPATALFAGSLVLVCFLQGAQAVELALLCSLLAFALSELAAAAVPADWEPGSQGLLVWAALAGRAVGAVLFAVAAFAPRRRLRRPGLAVAVGPTGVVAVLLLIAVLVVPFAPGPPKTAFAATAWRLLEHDLHAVSVPLVLVAMIFAVASAGYIRRALMGRPTKPFPGDFAGWLAVAGVLATAAQVNQILHPPLSPGAVSLGQVLVLCSYAIVFAGAGFQVRSYGHRLTGTTVLEERRRIARDLHDGLAQELAYLRRHIDALEGTVDSEMNSHLRLAAERAQREVRLAVHGLSQPPGEPVDVSIAQLAGEVAARDHVELMLDIPPGIRLPAARAEALMRIACEAVGNAARHSGARRVTLIVRSLGPRVQLMVSDSGSGLSPSASAGDGFASMHRRARLVGGDLRIFSAPGGGTEVRATL